MLQNTNINKTPNAFLYYKNEYYVNGTEIVLSDEYISNNTFNGKKIWKYARFDHQTQYNGKNAYYFYAIHFDWLSFRKEDVDIYTKKDYAQYFIIESCKIEGAICQIIKPIRLSDEKNEKLKEYTTNLIENSANDWDYPELRFAWIIYICVMIGGLIFNQFYIIWLIASYIFFTFRKDILER